MAFFCLTSILFYSCNFKSGHPQAGLSQDPAATAMNEKVINAYADSIDKITGTIQRVTSLLYTNGDHTFYAEQYGDQQHPLLLTLNEDNYGLKNTRKKYYFKNDSLIFVRSKIIQPQQENPGIKENITYLRNNVAFKSAYKEGSDERELKTATYKSLNPEKGKNQETYQEQVRFIKDALAQAPPFDMVFEGIDHLPEESHINLRSKSSNVYRASIVLEERDGFTDSLINDPLKFKGEKIRFNWSIKDKQAFYVPVAGKVTSAKGLNK